MQEAIVKRFEENIQTPMKEIEKGEGETKIQIRSKDKDITYIIKDGYRVQVLEDGEVVVFLNKQ